MTSYFVSFIQKGFPDDDALEDDDGEVDEAAGTEQTDLNCNVEAKATFASEVQNSKNSSECAGCIQKAVEAEKWKKNTMMNLSNARS